VIRSLPVFLLLGLTLSACSTPPSPMEYTLTASDSSFAELLADLHRADVVALNVMEEQVFVPDHERQDSVLQSRGMSSEDYRQLVQQYADEPDRLVAVYNRALDIASGR